MLQVCVPCRRWHKPKSGQPQSPLAGYSFNNNNNSLLQQDKNTEDPGTDTAEDIDVGEERGEGEEEGERVRCKDCARSFLDLKTFLQHGEHCSGRDAVHQEYQDNSAGKGLDFLIDTFPNKCHIY